MSLGLSVFGQPSPCGPNPAMTSTCATACVVCNIDGFSGVNNLTAQGQGFDEFCTTQYNNMQYLAFIAGSEDLTIQVDVGTCVGGVNSLEVGFFQSDDCENFTRITDCDTEIPSNASSTFTNLVPLVIGQHYYLVIDGSGGANCDWTFNVIQGSTQVPPLTGSGIIAPPGFICPGSPATFSTSGEVGASSYAWTINGAPQLATSALTTELLFPADGTYEVCVQAGNACDDADPSCTSVEVRTPGTLNITERLCDGDCIEVNGNQYCNTGVFQEIISFAPGCDSIINIDIEVLPMATTNLEVWICNDVFYQVGNEFYNTTGIHNTTVLTADECDSLVILDLLVIECEIVGTTEEVPVICNGTATGKLIFSLDQGEPPLTYTYTNIADGSITGMGTTNLLIDNEISNIPAGSYQIYVSDNFGNDVVVLQDVTEPPVMSSTFMPSLYNGYNVSCFETLGEPGNDGTLQANALGGVPPYSYSWSNDQITQTASNLLAENYEVTITDDVGCTFTNDFTLISAPELMPTIDFRDPNCSGFETGQIEVVQVLGGVPGYQYALGDDVYQNNTLYNGLVEDNYTIQIIDANGCIYQDSSELIAPAIPVILSLEDITIELGDQGILVPFINIDEFQNIEWTDSSTLDCGNCLSPMAMPVNDAVYELSVTSIDDCSTEASVRITVDKTRGVYIPNAFSPNNDGVNDEFTIFGGNEVEEVTSLKIFSRWGSIVYSNENFQPNDLSIGWDGFFNGKAMDPSVFIYIAEVKFIDGVSIPYKGDFVLLR